MPTFQGGGMLSYQEALAAIDQYSKPLPAVSVPLAAALGYALAETVKAEMPFPHFDNSAVDGFAIRSKEKNQKQFKFRGEIPAGQTQKLTLKPGEAAAVFTGAPTPEGTTAVVMQECAERRNGSVLIEEVPEFFENIRRRGEDFKKGEGLIPKGTCLEPQHLALLAALGRSQVKIVRPLKLAVLATGNELVFPETPLRRGQIYDSNTPLLEALIKKTGARPVLLSKAPDDLRGIRRTVREGLREDVLIVCGGVSVGKYDFVKEALKKEGVREIFWKIDIKPGKPVFFGKKGKTLIFGLPGNPVSVYVTFEEFVKPLLLKKMGKKTEPVWIDGRLTKGYQNGKRPQFVRVQCQRQKKSFRIVPLKGQGSHQIAALAKANGILKVEAGQALRAGQTVRIKSMGNCCYE